MKGSLAYKEEYYPFLIFQMDIVPKYFYKNYFYFVRNIYNLLSDIKIYSTLLIFLICS